MKLRNIRYQLFLERQWEVRSVIENRNRNKVAKCFRTFWKSPLRRGGHCYFTQRWALLLYAEVGIATLNRGEAKRLTLTITCVTLLNCTVIALTCNHNTYVLYTNYTYIGYSKCSKYSYSPMRTVYTRTSCSIQLQILFSFILHICIF